MFKRLAEEIRIKCRVCKIFRQQLKEPIYLHISMTVRDKNAISMEEESKQCKMKFDHTLFKARQDCFPYTAELIVSKKPELRTNGEIQYLCSLLRTLQSFQQYSSHLQMLLAKVFRFERFGRRRVIIKKGHVGSSFYFIYSGSVAICSDEDGNSIFLDQEPYQLHKGDKFGDIALLKGQRRNATVVCTSATEFLVVDKKDFFANKLDEQLYKEFTYRFDYFRSLDIFSHWLPEHITNISENCQVREYHYGHLITQNTRESRCIVFITEGTCEVLRLVKLIDCPSYHSWLLASLHTSHPQKQSHTTQKHPKSEQPLKQSYVKPSSEQPYGSGTTKLHAHKLAALKEAVQFCLSEKKSLKNIEEIHTLKGHHDVDAAVLLKIDLLHEREFLGLHELQDNQKDKRSLMLVSKGCKIIFLKMEKFIEFCDPKTLEKLQKYQKSYQSDDILCKLFLQENDWKMYKRDLVNLLVKPLNTHQPTRERTAKQTQPSPSLSQSGILDLHSTFQEKQDTSTISQPKGMYVSTQERRQRQNPSDRTVHLVHEIVVSRPDRILQYTKK